MAGASTQGPAPRKRGRTFAPRHFKYDGRPRRPPNRYGSTPHTTAPFCTITIRSFIAPADPSLGEYE